MTDSIIRKIVESISRRLNDSDFFRTVPRVPVIVEDSKAIIEEISRASDKSCGAFCLVSFAGAETDNESPGPYLSTCTFRVAVIEFPQFWRSKPGKTPTCTEIAEAVCRLIHHYGPTDIDGNALSNGVMQFQEMTASSDDSSLIQTITFFLPLVLSPDVPTR